MEDDLINKLWDDFAENFPFTDKQLPYVYFYCKKFKIDPLLFQKNLFGLTANTNIPDINEDLKPSKSIIKLKVLLPAAFPITYAAAFPDVVVWFMESYETEAYSTNPYFVELKTNPDNYFDKETGTAKWSFLGLITLAYSELHPFENTLVETKKAEVAEDTDTPKLLSAPMSKADIVKKAMEGFYNTDYAPTIKRENE